MITKWITTEIISNLRIGGVDMRVCAEKEHACE